MFVIIVDPPGVPNTIHSLPFFSTICKNQPNPGEILYLKSKSIVPSLLISKGDRLEPEPVPKVVEKTVEFYIKKTGAWKLKGNDKYCKDAKKIAEKLLNK